MSVIKRKVYSIILTLIFSLTSVSCFAGVRVFAADFDDLNVDSIFLKQNTSNTCTLSSAAMMLRRTAVCAGYTNWGDITEANIRSEGWIDGVGLRWSFSCYDMTVGHGYFSGSDNKLDMIDLLDKYPQGVVVYNGGRNGQHHAVFLCDYDADTDTFYVADPTSTAPAGRIKLEDSTIVGESQTAQINNFTAYWYVSDPVIEYSNGNYSAVAGSDNSDDFVNNQYDPTDDCNIFESTKTDVSSYYVVTDTVSSGSALRNYPSGNSTVADYAKRGTILYLDCQGTNKFGALWYKTSDGYYIFSSNVTPYGEYSSEILKFSSTVQPSVGTYSVLSDSLALRIEPSEGNNIAAYAEKGSLLYVTESGVNSVGSKWYKTVEGYYIKASEVKFKTDEKLPEAIFNGTEKLITGIYSSEPIEDEADVTAYEPGYYEITASALNIRKAPVSGAVMTSVPKGTFVKVTAVDEGWGRISYNGYEGWISLDYVKAVDYESVPLEISSFKLSSTAIESGSVVSCSVSVADDITCMYKYSLYDIGGNLIFSDTSGRIASKFSYTINESGYYYFGVEVFDSFDRSASSYSASFLVYDKLQLDSVTSNVDGFTYEYDVIEWTANASSVSSDTIYNYSLYCDGNLISEKQSTESEFSYTPESSGSYVLEVYISDDLSETEPIASDAVEVYAALSIDAINLSATSALFGSDISCSINASGGTGEYTYCFSVFKDGKLIKNGAFSDSDMTVHQFSDIGTYKFFCTVMDSGSMLVSSFSADLVIFDQLTGDVDSDGVVTAKDARLVLRYSAVLEDLPDMGKTAADVNNDGKINAFDARYILRYAAKVENSFV